MQNKKFKFIVLGGGTAGMMVATYLKSYWNDNIEVVVVYDHKNPGIGVGESLTPVFLRFLKSINISVTDLINNANATIKLGLKFKNWLEGSYYYHPFLQIDQVDEFNYTLASSIVNNKNNLFTNEEYVLYDSYYFENDKIPVTLEGAVLGNHSLHIDATLFSKYLEKRFADRLVIKDNVVIDVIKHSNGHIKNLICSNGEIIEGDFYIDASGFQRVLFKHIETNTWNDMKDWLPLDKCIPNPVFTEFSKQPTYTTSEASEDGWILQVPLQNRWGAGYLYSSEFISDEIAFEKFSKFIKSRYGKDLTNTSRVIKFDSGYWEKQWVGNCLSVGLSCGFSEPLEATNIHQVAEQLLIFTQMFNFEIQDYDVEYYNKICKIIFENIYMYLRFCYCNGRDDTEFWKYITYNEPKQITNLKNKISKEIVNAYNLNFGMPFNYTNFSLVANGLNLIDKNKYLEILEKRNMYEASKKQNEIFSRYKKMHQQNAMDHLEFLRKEKQC